jgi:hypothetical protein
METCWRRCRRKLDAGVRGVAVNVTVDVEACYFDRQTVLKKRKAS